MENDKNDTGIANLKYLWDEYRYRHALCWTAVNSVAAAVVALGAIPYVKDTLTLTLRFWMLVPPVVGTALATFGVCLLNNELKLFGKIKLAYRALQNDFLKKALQDDWLRNAVMHPVSAPISASHFDFDTYVRVFMVALVLLSGLNAIFLATQWIPQVSGAAGEVAVRARVAAVESAWNARDAESLTAVYTFQGDAILMNGIRHVGPDAIRRAVTESWSNMRPDSRVSIAVETVRFIHPDVAIVESTAKFTVNEPSQARATWVMVREARTWAVAALRVMPVEP